MTAHPALQRLVTDLDFWYATVYKSPTYPWQVEICKAIEAAVDDALNGRASQSEELVVMCSRQAGKNETAARTEARLLMKRRVLGGKVVKCAPTWTPQLNISKDRLKEVTARPLFQSGRDTFVWEEGRVLRCGNASLTLVSAEPSANKVGHTASLLLEADESQDICPTVYGRDFRPMVATTQAPTVLYGTAWSTDSLLEMKRQQARDRQRRLGKQLLFEADWQKVAACNENYRRHVEGEIAVYGAEHIIIRTQYGLESIEAAGRFIDPVWLRRMRGGHQRQFEPHPERFYVAGVDLCGYIEQDLQQALVKVGTDAREKRDSTVATVCELMYRWDAAANRRVPLLRVVDHLLMTGTHPIDCAEALYRFLFDRWQCISVVVDASGVGDAVAAMLEARRPNQVAALKSTVSEVSRLGYNLQGAIITERFKMYRDDDSVEAQEFWIQMGECRRELRENNQLRFAAPTTKQLHPVTGVKTDVHDDMVKSAAYAVEAAERHLARYVDDSVISGRDQEPYWDGDEPRPVNYDGDF